MKTFLIVAVVMIAIFAYAEERSRHMKVTATNKADAGKLGTLYAATFEKENVLMPLACTTKLKDGSDNSWCQMPIVGEHYEVQYEWNGWYAVTGPDDFLAEMRLGAFWK